MLPLRTLHGLARSFRLLPVRAQRCQSMSVRNSNAIYRVALTGGPCGGKSSSLDAISIDIYTVPEVPTILMTGGCKALIDLQIQMEDSFYQIAQTTGRTSVIVMDRGILDISAYLPPEQWNRLLQVSGLSLDKLLTRYDGVLHLVTAADGAEDFYKHGEASFIFADSSQPE
ncbi:hypothetical protein GUITHDRAFT_102909 [Guillardia theta CCMP2712]|uniref:NadR/Ttd14 AAA domain-containing protein n=1 Tax=Guillardia theta (strain CCMP2712) TaxID=905079 RepID=L1JT78_GUITC|nr:hypothetical protein GUITHDRAFT_102909 [Guillardia theta CCMP2712]EKX51647.1 hypothetical protein GUITHDRAFT_102909 [Guillardia theta CCMP2712]|eukprot:XP_005838627.1 hypothetical protein GUITHDRAFT_102909 [Guillardia theta CCMP2712]